MAAPMPNSGRDLRFDSLRGLMLIVMTINHLPSLLRRATDESLGIFSAAEGFVFLSGLLAGYVYTRRSRREGPAALLAATRKRANRIYFWQLASFLGAFVAVRLTGILFGFYATSSPILFYQNPWLAILLGCTMLYQPGMIDILPLYCALVVALPHVINALEKGRRNWVLAISGALWFAMQWVAPVDGAPLFPVHVGSFNLLSWQFLFFLGVVIGHERVARPGPQVPFRPLLMLPAAAVAVYCWGINKLGWRPAWSDDLFGIMLNKPNLGLLRLTNFAVAAYLVSIAAVRFPRLFTWPALAFLGRHSLVVFAVQSVVGISLLEFPGLFASPAGNWLWTFFAIAMLFAAAALHECWQRRSDRPRSGEAGPLDPRQDPPHPLASRHDIRAA
jgi:hypothetical protein